MVLKSIEHCGQLNTWNLIERCWTKITVTLKTKGVVFFILLGKNCHSAYRAAKLFYTKFAFVSDIKRG